MRMVTAFRIPAGATIGYLGHTVEVAAREGVLVQADSAVVDAIHEQEEGDRRGAPGDETALRIVISGPQGAGKSRLQRLLLALQEGLGGTSEELRVLLAGAKLRVLLAGATIETRQSPPSPRQTRRRKP